MNKEKKTQEVRRCTEAVEVNYITIDHVTHTRVVDLGNGIEIPVEPKGQSPRSHTSWRRPMRHEHLSELCQAHVTHGVQYNSVSNGGSLLHSDDVFLPLDSLKLSRKLSSVHGKQMIRLRWYGRGRSRWLCLCCDPF